VNYGCPGETTTTFIAGGCPWLLAGGPLHDSFGGASSQLTAALSFLAAHPGQVSLISLDIGSNDLLAVLAACGTNQTCIAARVGSPTQAGTLLGNYAQILAALRQAAPNAQLVVFNFYNPEAIAVPGSDALLAPINAAIRQLAGAFDASVADAFRVINHRAGSPAEDTFVCHRTWMCTAYAAIHPNQLGYHQLAIALVHATRR
jgi:lysophospholipase L1-like esterase